MQVSFIIDMARPEAAAHLPHRALAALLLRSSGGHVTLAAALHLGQIQLPYLAGGRGLQHKGGGGGGVVLVQTL
jgi:hypothetical protein